MVAAESLPVPLASLFFLRGLLRQQAFFLHLLLTHIVNWDLRRLVRNDGEFRLAQGAGRHGVHIIKSSESLFFHCKSEQVEKKRKKVE